MRCEPDSRTAQRQYLKHTRQNLKKIGVLLICHYVWRQVLFGNPKQCIERQSINYRVLVFPVSISIAGAWFDEWLASLTSDGMS
jgi:hypothetical protein